MSSQPHEGNNEDKKVAIGYQPVRLAENIYQLRGPKNSCHVYLIKGRAKNVIIDTGVMGSFTLLTDSLRDLGIKVADISLVILTHEHVDHISACSMFHEKSLVAAHRLAANKVELQDEFVTFQQYRKQPGKRFWVDIWLEDGSIIDLGNYILQVIHTPGHTSGGICLYEFNEGLLFSGDTIFAGGILSEISVGGNVSDYVNSVRRLSQLKMKMVCPGHGKVSSTPDDDLLNAIGYAETMMNDCKMFFEAFIKTRHLQDKAGSVYGFWEGQQPTD
jgi:hydroxyacylglutathione hydrolase